MEASHDEFAVLDSEGYKFDMSKEKEKRVEERADWTVKGYEPEKGTVLIVASGLLFPVVKMLSAAIEETLVEFGISREKDGNPPIEDIGVSPNTRTIFFNTSIVELSRTFHSTEKETEEKEEKGGRVQILWEVL